MLTLLRLKENDRLINVEVRPHQFGRWRKDIPFPQIRQLNTRKSEKTPLENDADLAPGCDGKDMSALQSIGVLEWQSRPATGLMAADPPFRRHWLHKRGSFPACTQLDAVAVAMMQMVIRIGGLIFSPPLVITRSRVNFRSLR